jgi:O-antigen/teichoic acid export membrane protein
MLSTIKSTLKNTVIYSIGTFSSKLVGLILIPLYTAKFDTAQYGMMGIMEISSQVLTALLGFGLFNAYFRWYWDPKYIEKQKSLLFTIIIFFLLQLVLFFVLVFTIRGELSYLLFESKEQTYLISLLFYVSAFEAFQVIISTLLRLKEKAGLYTVIQVTKLVVSLVVTIYLIKYKGEGIEAVYESLLLANFVTFILILDVLIKSSVARFEWKVLGEMISFSFPLMLTTLSGIILNITDRYTLRFITDLDTVGIYTLGFKIANTIRIVVISSVNLALQPVLFRMMDVPDNKRFYSKAFTYFTFGLMFFVMLFAFYSKEIVEAISTSSAYLEAYKIIPVLSLSMLFTMFRDVIYTGLNKMKKTKMIAAIIVSASVINILLNLLFIPIWNYQGAAYATSLSQVIFFIMVYYFSQKSYYIPYEMKKVMLMIATGIGLYIISRILDILPLLYRVSLKFMLIVAFPFIIYIFGFYERKELDFLKLIWKKWHNPAGWVKNLKNFNQ